MPRINPKSPDNFLKAYELLQDELTFPEFTRWWFLPLDSSRFSPDDYVLWESIEPLIYREYPNALRPS